MALEVTGNAWEIKRLIEPHVAEVIVVSPGDTGTARVGEDRRLDARALARLLAAGELKAVWVPTANPGDAPAPAAPRPARPARRGQRTISTRP